MSNNSSDGEIDSGLNYILLIRLIVWGYAGIVISLFGIVGNIITILVLVSPSMRTTSTNIYLTALSCSNILFLLLFIPSYSIRYLIGYKLYIANQPPFAFELLLARLPTTPIYNTILLSIIYLTIAVSTDRLILIKMPLKAKHILTQRATVITILLIYLFSIVYCIPYWLEQRFDPELKQCQLTTIGKRIHKYTRIHAYIPIVYVIPFVTLAFINITIIQSLIAKKRRKKKLGAKTNKKKQADYYITLMLVTVIILFVLCQLPLLVLNAWFAIDPKGSSGSRAFHTLNSLGILLMVFNSSTNFLLYCFFGQKFRQTLIEFVLKRLPNQKKQGRSQSRTPLANGQARLSALPIKQPPPPVKLSNENVISTIVENTQITKLPSNDVEPTLDDVKVDLVEETRPLISTSDQVLIVNENASLKSEGQPNLYTCPDGKRILILKI